MTKKRVYVESTVPSYLTAEPSIDDLLRAQQGLTKVWWERRADWFCFLTPIVLWEISRGDKGAAAKRREKELLLSELPSSPEARALANLLVARKLVPETKAVDALHIALAAFHRADYLLTWNQTHLDNIVLRSRIEELIRGWGLTPAAVITPERLMEEPI